MKKSSPLVNNSRMKFDDKQYAYIANSFKDAIKAGYMNKDDLFVVEKAPHSFKDMDKCHLFLPDHMYKGTRQAWDMVPV